MQGRVWLCLVGSEFALSFSGVEFPIDKIKIQKFLLPFQLSPLLVRFKKIVSAQVYMVNSQKEHCVRTSGVMVISALSYNMNRVTTWAVGRNGSLFPSPLPESA
jgi:hypothetical protein